MGDNIQSGLLNINLESAADIVNNMIDKFANAVGWVVTPKGARKDMEVAIETYIEEIQRDSSLPPIIKAYKISRVRKEIKEYNNMQDILEHARKFYCKYEGDVKNESLDNDWSMYFYDKAKNVCRDDAKILWGKILAEECRSEGTIPKSLIHILSVMNQEDAILFENLCGFSPEGIDINGQVVRLDPLIGDPSIDSLPERYGLTYNAFQNLEALGLLHYNVVDIRTIFTEDVAGKIVQYKYFDSIIEIYDPQKEFPRGNVVFTRDGAILANLIEHKRINEFEEYVKNYYEGKNYKVVVKK